MNNHVYTIGTDRMLVEEFFDSYIDEVRNIIEKTGEETTLVVVDESPLAIQKINADIINRHRPNDIKLIHFNGEQQEALFDHIKNNISDTSILELLDYKGYSYGRVMNKQFMVASALGADYLHRRDSDVKIVNKKFGYPSDVEIKYLGKTIGELENHNLEGYERYNKDQCIYMVGSGYSGKSDWKVDFGVFLEEDTELINEVTDLFGYNKDLSEEYYNQIITGNISFNKNEILLPEKNHPNPLCGNMSLYKIFQRLPCSTMLSTIGSDNLIRGFLKRLHSPIIYHGIFVYHQFTPDRDNNDMKYLTSYWPRVLNKLIYYTIIENLIYNYAKSKVECLKKIDNVKFDKVTNLNMLTYEYVESITLQSIEAFVGIMKKARNSKINAIGNYISTKHFADQSVKNTYYGVRNGSKLTEVWGEVVNICKTHKINNDGVTYQKICL